MARGSGGKSKTVEAEAEPTPTVVVDENAAAVEQAAAARFDATVGESVAPDGHDSGESDAGEALPGGLSWDEVNEATEEQLAEAIAPTTVDGEGLDGSPTTDDVFAAQKERYEEFTGGADDDALPTHEEQVGGDGAERTGPSSGPSASVTETGGTAAVGGTNVFGHDIDFGAGAPDANPLTGSPAVDPLTSAVDEFEAKTGRDSGLTTPGDTTNASPAHGVPSVASEMVVPISGRTTASFTVDDATGNIEGVRSYTKSEDGSIEVVRTPSFTEVTDNNNGTITTVFKDGSTTTTTTGGVPVDSTPPLKDPGPDGEVPLPEHLQNQLDAETARLRALREQGPDFGDGATDPSEIDSEVVGPASDLPDHAELGRDLLGQPGTDGEFGTGAESSNPGVNSHGAHVTTPGEDQELSEVGRRNDNPFDAAEPALEPPPDSYDSGTESDDGGELGLPPSDIVGPVDDPGEIPVDDILYQ